MSAGVRATALPWRQYLCRICGLIYDEARGDADSGLAAGTRFEDIPADWACPICGVTKADFELHDPATAPALQQAPRAAPAARGDAGVLIVGAGRAGWQVAKALRARNSRVPITMLSACSGDVYDKPQLSVAVARGLAPRSLVRESADAAARALNLRLLPHTHAVAIDLARRRLRSTRGSLRWRHLVLAHGAEPVPHARLPPALVWRINDLRAYQALRATLDGAPRRVAIVGAGLVGCELANDLALAGHAITLIDVQAHPLATLLPEAQAQRLMDAWQGLDIRFIAAAQVAGVDAGAPLRLRLQDGRVFEAEHIVAATGLRAPSRLAVSAGLVFDMAAGGIVVDAATGATSAPGVHALGDCVVVNGRASRFIAPIAGQAERIAAAVLGHAAPVQPDAAPLLRIKTSSLPMTLVPRSSGGWHVQP